MKKNNLFCSFLIAFFISSAAFAAKENDDLFADKIDPSRFFNVAVIQGLNKTTAKTSVFDAKIGEKIKFGTISVIAHKCWQAPLDQKPESKILMEVFEYKNDETGKPKEIRIFYGWMFASSPSISGLEHPIYDLIALSCKNK